MENEMHYTIHMSQLQVRILCQMNFVTSPTYFFKIQFSIILPYTLRSPKWSKFPFLVCTVYRNMPHPFSPFLMLWP
jgi:hypothetical protein